MEAKPVVDGVERDLDGSARVVRVDLLSDTGARLARRYAVTFTPTFVFLDGAGGVVATAHRLEREAAVARLRGLR